MGDSFKQSLIDESTEEDEQLSLFWLVLVSGLDKDVPSVDSDEQLSRREHILFDVLRGEELGEVVIAVRVVLKAQFSHESGRVSDNHSLQSHHSDDVLGLGDVALCNEGEGMDEGGSHLEPFHFGGTDAVGVPEGGLFIAANELEFLARSLVADLAEA